MQNYNLFSQINMIGNSSFEDFFSNSNTPKYWFFRNNNSKASILKKNPPINGGLNSGIYYSSIDNNCTSLATFNSQNACGSNSISRSIKSNHPVIFEFNKPSSCSTSVSSNVTPKTGNHYLALKETSQTNKDGVDNDLGNPLELKTEYKISFWYMLPLPSEYRMLDFRVFLSSSQRNSDKELVKINTSDVDDKSPGVWYYFEKTFKLVDDNDDDLDIISLMSFRCVSGLNYDHGEPFSTIFIDDVSLMTTCNNPCSPYVGPFNIVNPSSNDGINSEDPFCITGLENVKTAEIKITTSIGQELESYTLIDPKDKICFDLNGATFANYNFKITVKNDCREKELNFLIRKIGHFNRSDEDIFNEYKDFLPPFNAVQKQSTKRCCNPDLHIKDETFYGQKLFESPVKITLGPNVLIGYTADIHLIAGQLIEIIEPVEIEQGCNFVAEIGNCTPDPVSNILPPNKPKYNILDFKNNQRALIEILLSPNPSSNELNVKCLGYNINSYQILNNQGVLIKEIKLNEIINFGYRFDTINIDDLSAGCYLIKAIDNNNLTLGVETFIKS